MNQLRMTLTPMVLSLVITLAAPAASGQSHREHDRDVEEEQIRAEQRQGRTDTAAIAALKERIRHNEADLAKLQESVEQLWDAHRKTDTIANGIQEKVAFLYAMGRPVAAFFVFIGGIVVTVLVTNFLNRRKARHAGAMAARRGS